VIHSHTLPFRPVPNYPKQSCKHYREYRTELETIDDILQRSGLDEFMLQEALEKRAAERPDPRDYQRGLEAFIQHSRSAFRISILRPLKHSASVRALEITLADSPLEQWFCFIESFDQIRAPSKSAIDRHKNLFGEHSHHRAFEMLLQKAASAPESYEPEFEAVVNLLGFEMPTNLLEVWYDSTCMAPNIHFPVDWVQLGDCCRTLLKAVRCIRRHGIKNRMPRGGADKLLSELNALCMSLGNARRRKDSKKQRKAVLRQMKKFAKRMARHAGTHLQLLEQHREEKTTLSPAQAALIAGRITGVLDQLPRAIDQAHERIIGERRVANADKILSIYEPAVKVIKRGKSGAEVEYGNQLLIGENRDGLVTHYELFEDVRVDSKRLLCAVDKTEHTVGDPLNLICGDKGFSEADVMARLVETRPGLREHASPKSPHLSREKEKDPDFLRSQKRRAQTEARIAIITNVYQRGRSLSKGIDSQRRELDWVMLAHNLRKLARMRMREEQQRKEKQAAA
jgi:hypothetical protein